jgi:DNA-binding transcriptional LysR family regulator
MDTRFTLRQLNYFIAVVETGTLRAAAQRLNISQSALSEGLSELEQDLKTRLLIRQRAQGVTLTSVGRELLEYARATVHSAEMLQAAASGRERVLAGAMVIGCYTTLAPFIIPPLVDALRARHPDLRIEVLEGSADEIQAELQQGRCECAFLYNFDLLVGIESEVLYQTRPHVLLPGRHKLTARSVVDLRALANEPLILFDLPPSRRNTQMIFNELGVTPNIYLRSKNFELVRSLVGRGLGYSILIQRPPMQKSYEGNPVAIREIAKTSAVFAVTFAYMKQNVRSYRLDALREICRECWRRGSE